MPPRKKATKGHCGGVPTSPKGKKPVETPPSSNTRSGRRTQPNRDESSMPSKVRKNAQENKGKRVTTMGAVREEADEEQFLLSPPTASRKLAAPTPTVAAAAGTLVYLNSYGNTAAHADALASDEEIDFMPDGTCVVSRAAIRSQGGKGSKSASAELSIRSKGGKSASAEASIVGIPHLPSFQAYATSEKSDSDFSVAAGLEFSDDDEVLDLHVDSDDGMRSSFPKDTRPKTLILGGPQPPDPTGLAEDEYRVVYDKYRNVRKAYTDKRRSELAKAAHAAGGLALQYTGCCSEQLRPLQEVDCHPLQPGLTFPGKDILHLRIAEEAMHRGIATKINRSDDTNLTIVGVDFYVRASFTTASGWTANCVICREGDDLLQIPPKDRVYSLAEDDTKKRTVTTPLKAKMIVPIILGAVAEMPGIQYQSLREILKPYVKDYALTDSILQEGRDLAKNVLFGSAQENVQYAEGVQAELRAMGHEVELLYADRKETIQQVGAVVLSEEMIRLKKLKTTMDPEEQKRYVKRWKKDNEIFLNNVFGLADLSHLKKFLKGILVAPSSSKHLAPLLQDVFQADGAHSNFGKYTLFSVYGTNANGHMSALAFGLLFGNEDKANWSSFWAFVKKIHPSIDALPKTILTDQDKGSIAAVKEIFELAAQFMCAFHRRQNILSKCGGGKGNVPNTALWMFNLLCSCNSMAHLQQQKDKHYAKLHPTDYHYLTKLPDECQYPAARCAMGDNICMFGKSASSGVESMNSANQLARQKTAVDALNGAILLLKLEADRFQRYKQLAWERDDILTDKGFRLMEECFTDVRVRDYRITVLPIQDGHRATVTKCKINATKFTVVIPATGKYDSRFGTCNCGKPTKDGVPCEHMVAIVKSSCIDGLSRIQMMPYWWTNAHWRAQYAMNVECRADISISTLKDKYTPDDTLCYCPAWTAGRKKGRPKKNVREKSVMDYVAESEKKKRKRKARMFCKICHRFNHNTEDCRMNTNDEGRKNDNVDGLDVMDMLEEGKPNVDGMEGMV